MRAIEIGLGAVPDDVDLLAVGEMGIANTTPAAAIAAALAGRAGREAGPGPAPDSTPAACAQGGGDRGGRWTGTAPR